ncbi:MAG: 50S ribosomal protein L11 methyltransferase [Proteobacteria bacterium]|nr:50S ribosomal protein L11 methyltransferase [Pseudomonadota bacterium]
MNWLQIVLDTEANKVDEISDALTDIGAVSVTWLDAKDQPMYEPSLNTTPLWKHTRIMALFEAEIDIVQLQTLNLPPYQIQTLEDKEWVRVWMDDFHPMQFGKNVWICPSWQTPPNLQAINIILDPGLAFGTGTHTTTALCLEWLDSQNDLTDKTVIDYGCGSGILAITAAKLGAKHIWAVDNDPQALEATENNSKKNKVEKLITSVFPAKLPEHIKADCILANILATPLINLAPIMAKHADSYIVLSGILPEQTKDIITAYEPYFEIKEEIERDGWMCIVGKILVISSNS